MLNIHNIHTVNCVKTNWSKFTVAAGAAGWVDTDVSAYTGLGTTRVFMIAMIPSLGGLTMGARPHGSAGDSQLSYEVFTLSKVDVNGHIDFYRDAGGNIDYYFNGYLA